MTTTASTGPDTHQTSLDPRTALALVALILGVVFALVRADAPAGYGSFAAVIAAIAWLAVWTLAALGSGRPLVRWIAPREAWDWESEVVAAGLGAAVLIVCAAALSTLGLFRPWPLLTVVLLWSIVGAAELLRRPSARTSLDLRVGPLFGLAAVTALIATVVSPFYDQWHQHLGFPWLWLQTGSMHSLPHDWYSFMPVNSSLLFAYGLGTLGQWSAQIVHWWCGLVAVLATGSLARRLGNRTASLWAVWIFATTPVVLHLATTAGSDLVVSMFAAGAWIALLRTVDDEAHAGRWWIVAGAFVGLAAGTKYIALGTVAIPVAVGATVLHRPWRGGEAAKTFLRRVSPCLLSAVLVFSPWALRNLIATGNPLFPFANGLFEGTLRLPAESAGGFSTTLSGIDTSIGHIIGGLDLGSFEASIDGFPSIGFVYLALIVMAVAEAVRFRRHTTTSALSLGALAGISFWLVTMHASRYLVPVLVPLAAVLGASAAAVMDRLPKRLRFGTIALVGLLFALTLAGSVTPIGAERLASALGVADIEPLLARWVSSTPALEAVASLDEDAKVFMIAEARALGFDRPVVFSDPYRDPLLLELARTSTSSRDLALRLSDMGVTHVLANHWEALRSARLRGTSGFFVTRDPEVVDRLATFCGRCLDPVWSSPGLSLYRLAPDCDAASPGGAEIASW